MDKEKGRFIYSPKRREKIWSCEDCGWIHRRKITESIFALIRENKDRIRKETFSPKPKRQDLKNGKIGIVILSHGSKLKKANASLSKTIGVIKQKTGLDIVVPAYLQFCQPDLAKSVKSLITQGCQTIIIVPFFLFNGNHVTRDIPDIIESEKAKHPRINFKYTKNLSQDTRIANIVVDIIEEAVDSEDNYRSKRD